MDRLREKLKTYFPIHVHGWLVFIAAIGLASLVCLLLRRVTTSDFHAPLIFVLAVLVVSLMTDGYFFGLLAAVTSVFAVNWAFTYPYMKMNFSIYGYPLTFVTMTAVCLAVSTLTGRVREQEKIRIESEREKMRANLLRAVSHDLRTPLTSISGSISALIEDEGGISPRQRLELLTDARDNADWLCRMVENLLSITKISGGSVQEIAKSKEMLEEVISEAVINFRKRAPETEVTVSVPDTILFVPMDAMLIEQVLINLMDNSVIHGVNTTHIWINAGMEEGYAVIHLSDNGGGIDSRRMEHLFDGSLQLTGGHGADGTRCMGIGLSVCRTIVEAHGGTIRAENNSLGAEFVFTLRCEEGGNENYEYSG